MVFNTKVEKLGENNLYLFINWNDQVSHINYVKKKTRITGLNRTLIAHEIFAEGQRNVFAKNVLDNCNYNLFLFIS